MALVTQFTCTNCNQLRHEVVVSNRICQHCRGELNRIAEKAHMERLAILSIEERIRRIELALYHLNAESRLRALESRHITY